MKDGGDERENRKEGQKKLQEEKEDKKYMRTGRDCQKNIGKAVRRIKIARETE